MHFPRIFSITKCLFMLWTRVLKNHCVQACVLHRAYFSKSWFTQTGVTMHIYISWHVDSTSFTIPSSTSTHSSVAAPVARALPSVSPLLVVLHPSPGLDNPSDIPSLPSSTTPISTPTILNPTTTIPTPIEPLPCHPMTTWSKNNIHKTHSETHVHYHPNHSASRTHQPCTSHKRSTMAVYHEWRV